MPLRIGDLIRIIETDRIPLPKSGTGRGKQIVARDLERTIGDHYADRITNAHTREHLLLRRTYTPMKAYRFNNLKPDEQDAVFIDDNDWAVEEKINGWRCMVTFIPHTAPMFWGGNLSTVDFLPVDYTQHVVLKQGASAYPATSKQFTGMIDHACILDCEVTVKEHGQEQTNDHAALLKVQEILGSNPDRARRTQTQDTLVFKVFDYINPAKPTETYIERKLKAVGVIAALNNPLGHNLVQFEKVPFYLQNKKEYANKIWKSGGEGVILKNLGASYLPGSRLRTHQIKVKRTHAGTVGDDIDAFVTRVFDTPEWTKRNMIGGVELSVYLNDEIHVIAKVTSMPDHVRTKITDNPEAWIDKVLIVDGQDLSSVNRRLLHAKVLWSRGVRKDKRPQDCTIDLDDIEKVQF